MRAGRSQQVEQLYHAARERKPDERAAFLAQACAGDDALRREVESLLVEEDGVRSFLETPALEFVNNIPAKTQANRWWAASLVPTSLCPCWPKAEWVKSAVPAIRS